MTQVIVFSIVLIFFLLSAIHIYWALGGRWGHDVVLPIIEGRSVTSPSRFVTLLVASLLLIAGFIILGRMYYSKTSLSWLFSWGSWGIVTIFFIRSVGDFRTVGFFKKIRNTQFAYWDTRLFSPLSLLISIFTLLVIIRITS